MSYKKAMFINPVIDDKLCATPPLGMLFILSYLREKCKDFEFKFIDFNVLKPSDSIQRDILKREKPTIVGIYTCTNYLNCSLQLARFVKESIPECKVVLGGHHVSARPYEIYPDVDCVVVGEGEVAFKDLLDMIRKNKPFPKVYKSNILLDDINFWPAWDQIDDLGAYSPVGVYFQHTPQAWITGSRGCPFNCFFCASIVYRDYKPRVRFRDPENIIEEILYLKKRFAIKGFFFTDDEINARPEWLEAICDLLIKEKINIKWCGQFRTNKNLLPERLIAKIKKAGCYAGGMGIESGNDFVLKRIQKNSTVKNNYRALKLLKKYKIISHGCFLIANVWPDEKGKPEGETLDQINDTLAFIKKVTKEGLLTSASISIATPYPGSGLEKLLNRYHLIYEPDYTKWNKDYIMRQKMVFKHPSLSDYDVQRVYQEIWEAVVINKGLIFQRLIMLSSFEDLKNFLKNSHYVLRKIIDGRKRLKRIKTL